MKKIIFSIITIIILLSSCKKEETKKTSSRLSIKLITEDTAVTYFDVYAEAQVSNPDNETIIEEGICISTDALPTISDTKEIGDRSIFVKDTFRCQISNNVKRNTTYHIRAYVTTNSGTTYSDELSVKTPLGTVEDGSGNLYQVVQIGTQLWMAENLKTTRYNDRTSISTGQNNMGWSTTTTGAYCIYNNSTTYGDVFGKLYNGYAVKTGKLAPFGCHVPTKDEYETLITYLGGANIAGEKLKGGIFWVPYTGITNSNSSKFNAQPAGTRSYTDGSFNFVNNSTYLWTTSVWSNTELYSYKLTDKFSSVGSNASPLNEGYSVRCIVEN